MNEFKEETQAFQIRLPKTLWTFLKKEAVEQDLPMQRIINRCLKKYKIAKEKKKNVDNEY